MSQGSAEAEHVGVKELANGFAHQLDLGQPLTAPEMTLVEHLDQQGQVVDGVAFEQTSAGMIAVLQPAPWLGKRLLQTLRRAAARAGEDFGKPLPAHRLPGLADQFAERGEHVLAAGAALLAMRLRRAARPARSDAELLKLAQGAQESLDAAQEPVLSLSLACWQHESLRQRSDDDDVQLLRSGLDLSERLTSAGRTQAALGLLQWVLVICQRELGAEHGITRKAAAQRAQALSIVGDEASASRVRAAAGIGAAPSRGQALLSTQHSGDDELSRILMRIEGLGDEHPETLKQAGLIAARLQLQGEYRDARRLQALVYEIRQRVHGDEHQETLTSANQLADTLRAQGDLAGARRLQESVFQKRQRLLGAEHRDTLLSANNLACTLWEVGDLAGARRLHESVFETIRRVRGAEHPDTFSSANNLAETLRAQGDLAGARRIAESVLKSRRRLLGAEHPDTLISANNLALTLWAQGDLASALRIEESLFETRQRLLGAEHPDTLFSASNLAMTLRAQGDLAGARRIQETAFESCQRVLGAEHPDTLGQASNLAQTLHGLREISVAGALSAQLLTALVKVGVTNNVGFTASAGLPVLCEPAAAWPEPTLRSLAELLPELSKMLTHRLELLPHESWDAQFGQYETFHRRWFGFAALHAPAQLLPALSGLHGIRSTSQVQAGSNELRAVAADASNLASSAVGHYLQARAAVNSLRENIATLFNRDGPAAPGLAELRAKERPASRAREKAEAELARVAPDLAAELGVLGRLSEEVVRQSLQAAEAWLTVAPIDPPLGLLLRPGLPTETITISALGDLRSLCDDYVKAVREGRQSSLRDTLSLDPIVPAFPAMPDPGLVRPSSGDLLAKARQLCADAFWAPLAPLLVGVRRLHLVTASGQHELLLEFALPPELSSLEVLRYSGLAAYQRSLLPDVRQAPANALPLLVITDTAEQTDCPIPFTRLDAVVPLRRGRAQRVSAGELLQRLTESDEPLAVLISAHGDVARPQGDQLGGGHVRLPDGVELDPKTLATLRGQIAWLMWVSCWAARVVHGGQGEPYGAISTLQHKGLRGGIGCLAPVPDFYSPLLSAAVWHERLQGAGAAAALTKAKSRLLEGDWAGMEKDVETLRQEYRALMLKLLQPLREQAEQPGWDPWQWHDERLQRVVRAWPMDGPVVHALQQYSVAVVLGTDLAQHESTIDDCLQSLFMPARVRLQENDERSQRVQQEIERLCAVVVAFGRG